MKPCGMYSMVGRLALLLLPGCALAQESTQDIRRQLDGLRAQMAEQLKQMDALQTRLDELERVKTTVPTAPTATTAAAPQTPDTPRVSSQPVGQATSRYQTFAQDAVAAARVDNVPLDPKFPDFFRLPGTSTFLKIGGYFKTDFIHDIKPAGDPDRFIPSSIPVGLPGANNANVSIRPTRMSLDFHMPVKALGDLRFYVETDLFGSNATTPRLRHAYAQAKNFLIGQTFSNFQDPDALPDGLDFQGPNSLVALRNPQFRYTVALAKKTVLSVAIEKPTSDLAFKTPEFNALPNSPSADGTVKFRQETPGGHIQVASVFRSISAYLPNGKSDSVFGWGVNLSGAQRVVGRDVFTYQVAYGAGMQHYVNDTAGLGIDAAVVSASQPYLRALPLIATYFGYQHHWGDRFRSSAIYGFAQVDNTDIQPGSTYHKSDYMAGNLIWNVFGSLNVGTEFLYGWVRKKDNSSANAPRFMISAKYDLNFTKRPE